MAVRAADSARRAAAFEVEDAGARAQVVAFVRHAHLAAQRVEECLATLNRALLLPRAVRSAMLSRDLLRRGRGLVVA
jgi:hypothetical protein